MLSLPCVSRDTPECLARTAAASPAQNACLRQLHLAALSRPSFQATFVCCRPFTNHCSGAPCCGASGAATCPAAAAAAAACCGCTSCCRPAWLHGLLCSAVRWLSVRTGGSWSQASSQHQVGIKQCNTMFTYRVFDAYRHGSCQLELQHAFALQTDEYVGVNWLRTGGSWNRASSQRQVREVAACDHAFHTLGSIVSRVRTASSWCRVLCKHQVQLWRLREGVKKMLQCTHCWPAPGDIGLC